MEERQGSINSARAAALRLLDYCRRNGWAGFDPYDALNSRLFKAIPVLDFRLARLGLTQGVKRCPINLRPVLLVPRTQVSKGLALFLSSLIRLSRIGLADENEALGSLAPRLLALRSPGQRYACWGYSFDWQQRTHLVPKDSPNIICTTFSANALLDACERRPNQAWLEAAASAGDFLLNELFVPEDRARPYFRYTLVGRGEVHNANLLGAAFLCRVAGITGDKKYAGPALDAARFSVSRQNADGSWFYGELPSQRWIDNFHTGFNLVALREIRRHSGTTEFDAAMARGFAFYKARFFRGDGAPRYFHDATFPIDIHSVAQSLITLAAYRDAGEDNLDLACDVLGWTLRNMWSRRGFFYFQKRAALTVRTPFMRWSQAWMLLALSKLLLELEDRGEEAPGRASAWRP
jgi:hypothetical protein